MGNAMLGAGRQERDQRYMAGEERPGGLNFVTGRPPAGSLPPFVASTTGGTRLERPVCIWGAWHMRGQRRAIPADPGSRGLFVCSLSYFIAIHCECVRARFGGGVKGRDGSARCQGDSSGGSRPFGLSGAPGSGSGWASCRQIHSVCARSSTISVRWADLRFCVSI
jgi:hypothetical protein